MGVGAVAVAVAVAALRLTLEKEWDLTANRTIVPGIPSMFDVRILEGSKSLVLKEDINVCVYASLVMVGMLSSEEPRTRHT